MEFSLPGFEQTVHHDIQDQNMYVHISNMG